MLRSVIGLRGLKMIVKFTTICPHCGKEFEGKEEVDIEKPVI